jgi:hypothetical protein
MHINITSAGQFRDRFEALGRKDQFSYDALDLLFDYLEECDPDMELDVIAICCEYAEDTPWRIAQSYNIYVDALTPEDTEAVTTIVLAYLNDHTSVVGTTPAGTIVYCSSF